MDSVLDKLNDLVEKELNKIVLKGDITPTELEIANKAVCLIEKIKMVAAYEAGEERSERSYNRYRSYNDRDNYDSMNNYYMDRGYSGHSVKDRMIANLETIMMDNAKSESEKRAIESLIHKLSSENY